MSHTLHPLRRQRLQRSELAVPASNPTMIEKAADGAADFVFLRDSLVAIPFAFDIAKRSGALIRQNFAIAVLYNLLAVPLAVFGYVTPLVAALAMSGSSILVVANAMRLMRGNKNAELPSLSYNANAFPEPAE